MEELRVVQLYDWNWPTIEREYRRALELNQNDALVHAEFEEYLLTTRGEMNKLCESTGGTAALDPLGGSQVANINAGFVFGSSEMV